MHSSSISAIHSYAANEGAVAQQVPLWKANLSRFYLHIFEG